MVTMETQPQALLIVYQHPISCSWSSTRKKTDWWRKGKKGGEKERKSRMSLCCVQGGGITDWTVPLEWGNQLFKDQTDLKFSMTGCIIHQDGFISKNSQDYRVIVKSWAAKVSSSNITPPSSKHPLICRWLSLRHVCSQTLQTAAVTRLLHYTFSLWFYLLLFGKKKYIYI